MKPETIVKRLYKFYGTDERVAEATGVDQSTINRLRHGETQPSWKTYQALLLQLKLLDDHAK